MRYKKIMPPILIFLLLIFSSFVMIAQQFSAEYGYDLSTEGTMRMLLVFAEVDCSTGSCNQNCITTNTQWNAGQLPPAADDWFNHSSGTPTKHLTKYYDQASFGQYELLGDYFPEVVTVSCQDLVGKGVQNVLDTLDQWPSAISTANSHDLYEFDLINNEGAHGSLKYSASNDIIDCITIVWRNNAKYGCGAGNGHSHLGAGSTIKGKTAKMIGSWGDCSGDNFFLFTAEYIHALYGGNNFHTGSGAAKWSFLTSARSFSTTAQSASQSNTFTGWDRHRLGWYNPNHSLDTISALDVNRQITVSDLTIENNPASQTYILRDFYKTGDAIRIKLPHIDWQSNGDVKNQYLWLENHQLLSEFDDNRGCDKWVPGMYAYIQVGKDIKKGNTPGAIFPCSGSGCGPDPNGLGSFLFPLTAAGRHDFDYRTDLATQCSLNDDCCWGNKTLPIERSSSETKPNTFTGFSSLFNTYDWDGNGVLRSQNDIFQPGLSEVINGSVIYNAHQWGTSNTAFTLGSQNKLNIATNPAPVPVYTYRSNDYNDNLYPNDIPAWENRTIPLNGLSIEILDTIPNSNTGGHDIKVHVEWDNYEITQDVRWTGNIVLQNDPDDPQVRQSKIKINNGKTITIARGESPTQHISHDNYNGETMFTRPSKFTMKNGTELVAEANATLRVKDDSKLTMKPGSEMTLGSDADLVIKDDATMVVEGNSTFYSLGTTTIKDGGTLKLKGNSETVVNESITVEDGGRLVYEKGASLALQLSNSNLTVRGDLEIADNAIFTFGGYGFVAFDDHDNLNAGVNSEMVFEGFDTTDKVLVVKNASLNLPGHMNKFDIQNGKVKMNHAGTILTSTNTYFDYTKFTNIGNNRYVGVYFEGDQNKISNCIFDSGTVGFAAVLSAAKSKLAMDSCTFRNCEEALLTVGGGMVDSNSRYTNNTQIDAQLAGISLPSTIINGNFEGNPNKGIYAYSGVTASLTFKSNTITNYNRAFDLVGSFSSRLRCNEVHKNTSGIHLRQGANLTMDTDINGGFNDLRNNDYAIRAKGSGALYLNKGLNDLSSDEWDILGTINNMSNCPNPWMNAYENYWSIQTPSYGDNYKLTCDVWYPFPDYKIPIHDNSNPSHSIVCNDSYDFEVKFSPLNNCDECPVISSEYFEEAKLNDAVIKSSDKMGTDNEGTYDNVMAVAMFRDILADEDVQSGSSAEVRYLRDLSYIRMMQAVGNAFQTGEWTEENFNGGLKDELADVNQLLADSIESAKSRDLYKKRFYFSVDQMQLHRIAGLRGDAHEKLKSIMGWAEEKDQPYIENWLCLVRNEIDYLDGKISAITFVDNLDKCWQYGGGESSEKWSGPAAQNGPAQNKQEEKPHRKDTTGQRPGTDNLSLSIYPNPSSSHVNISLALPKDRKVDVVLYPIDGSSYLSVLNKTLTKGRHTYNLRQSLESGVYILRLQTTDHTEQRKVVIME